MNFRLLLLFVGVAWGARVSAFPEMIRHGYVQCTACHFSPSGGAALTPYGRQLSGELMSTWARPGEGLILHGLAGEAGLNKGIHFGGDIRSVQVHRENYREKDGRFFVMQAQAEALYQRDKFLFSLTVGEIERPMEPVFRGNVNASNYYGLVQLTDELSFRVGRFQPQYGLKLPDHTLITKNLFGFRPGLNRETMELAYLGEKWTGFLSLSETVAKTAASQKEKARAVGVAYSPNERMKVGVNHWVGKQDSGERNLSGVFANMGWTHKLFSMFELNWQKTADTKIQGGLVRTGYEVHKGLVPYAQLQQSQAESFGQVSRSTYYSLGVQFLPRPHFEVNGQWTRVHGPIESSDQAYLLLHYYL